MAVRLRLARAGAHNRAFYWLVAADSHMPRDGRYLEKLGTYDPRSNPRTAQLKVERVLYWLDRGAEPSEAVRELLRDQGILKNRAAAPPTAVTPPSGTAEAADPAGGESPPGA